MQYVIFKGGFRYFPMGTQTLFKRKSGGTIDIHGRSQTSYTPTSPCNGIGSHGAQIGDLRAFADHTRKNKCNTNAPTIFARGAAFYSHLSLPSDRQLMQVAYALEELWWFWLWEKNLKTPQFEPHARIKMAQVLGFLVYIYVWVAPGQISA